MQQQLKGLRPGDLKGCLAEPCGRGHRENEVQRLSAQHADPLHSPRPAGAISSRGFENDRPQAHRPSLRSSGRSPASFSGASRATATGGSDGRRPGGPRREGKGAEVGRRPAPRPLAGSRDRHGERDLDEPWTSAPTAGRSSSTCSATSTRCRSRAARRRALDERRRLGHAAALLAERPLDRVHVRPRPAATTSGS